MFEKIPLSTGWINKCRRGEFTTSYGSIMYYKIIGAIPPDLVKILRPDSMRYVEITSKWPVTPHRDHGVLTNLNLYISAGSAFTQFWEPQANARPVSFKEHTKITNSYKPEDLVRRDGFLASDGDAYLLDVSKIHSVEGLLLPERKFIQFSWRSSTYLDVLVKLSKLV